MDTKTAVKTYQFAERGKSLLIISSQLLTALPSFPEGERAGGKRMLLLLMESVRAELGFAVGSTGQREFQTGIDHMNQAISLIESEQYGPATLKISEAITATTTAAQGSWQILNEHGII
ncbi:MAG: hypothetical protein ABFC24_12575 [Methanoregulaceae archaeon]